MAENEKFPKPTFTIEDDGEFAELRLKSLENDIHKKPAIYKALITRLGPILTADTIAHDDRTTRSEVVSDNAAHRLHEFFSLRYDRLIEFDDSTENAIAENEDYKKLLKVHRNSANKDVKLGIQKKGSVPDVNAEPVRDQLRRKRLELYIGRVADWKADHSSDKQQRTPSKRKLKNVV